MLHGGAARSRKAAATALRLRTVHGFGGKKYSVPFVPAAAAAAAAASAVVFVRALLGLLESWNVWAAASTGAKGPQRARASEVESSVSVVVSGRCMWFVGS
ncbi:hypothetical protein PLESTB_001786200 [Pleodorina starrii]|uniref:Uncharacterized protein n=1 Tax=Pleodorina starrii TaxID=330485 RepID=A0A9W6C0D5_9CHLO|nr:hypothetical protein PLESTM_001757000 [Pleodorina starrii]GLC61644.1 hypothetical protein PLESTB_001786200 [Pleodorina starrii]GLC76533.1 hypothetical protein PLESTF_001793500 [Pleodorina starrii]